MRSAFRNPRGHFFKFCLKCDKKFKPSGPTVKFCDKCRQESFIERNKKSNEIQRDNRRKKDGKN